MNTALIRTDITSLQKYTDGTHIEIPLFATPVHCGFPSPAEEYEEERVDLNRDLIKNPDSTFYARAASNSMEPLIHTGALLIIDRAEETGHNDVVLAHVAGEFCIKRLCMKSNIRLLADNPAYPPIKITGEMDFSVWGKVIYAIQGL